MSVYENIEKDELEIFKSQINIDDDLLDYIYYAVECNAYFIADYLLKNYNLVNVYKEKFGKSLISLCCEKNDLKMLNLLLKYGEDINGNPLSLFNPLEVSLIDGNKEVFKELVLKGADLNFFLPRHNRTILDTAFMYDEQTKLSYEFYKRILIEHGAISTRGYFQKNNNYLGGELNLVLSEYFGKVLDFYFDFNDFKTSIFIGFIGKKTNYIFTNINNFVFMILLPFDWPLNNQEKYLNTEYSFFFKMLNFLSSQKLCGLDYIDIVKVCDQSIPVPNNIIGFQIIDLEFNENIHVKIFSPVESKKKKFSENLNEKDLVRMQYNWPKNKRGFSVYEDFFI
ncbi:ankyrin repeat domain-containing protein [Acinetobacter bereziniae]|uniref:ankyrin repeat domain-containing protein n=1 Tax=Acinetobacter bereziniae TaxID=106648 RepID=UPI0021E482A1|nr:ankyrin repeat domain-containing protein [Acinetobacter bereziniae]MCV2444892.1 ankyrin repeat domain-containing protein [Acinetobacter bereziniae]